MPMDDKNRSETILINADNLLALTETTELMIQDLAKAGVPVSPDLASVLARLFLTVRSLREQLHSIESERRNTPGSRT
jgi:hypothetical protein